MGKRRKYMLSLCRMRRRFTVPSPNCIKIQKKEWINSMDEIMNRVKWKEKYTPVKITSPSPTKKTSNHKRLRSATKSPFQKDKIVIARTPLKSPALKKVKTSLAERYGNEKCISQDIESQENVLPLLEDSFDIEVINETVHRQSPFNLDDNAHQQPSNDCAKTDLHAFEQLLPDVIEVFRENGMESKLLDFFKLVSERKFPMSNMAFLLWLEVVKWYKSGTTTSMRYSDQTKKFWKLGFRLFGGRFISFMSGFKNNSQIVLNTTVRGHYDPAESDINFAVPDLKILTAYNPYSLQLDKGVRKPGIAHEIINHLSTNVPNKSYCLTFDGKKLKPGLTKVEGDIDLLGFEKGSTLEEKKEIHAETKSPIIELKELIGYYKHDENTCNMNTQDKNLVKDKLLASFKTISSHYLTMTEIRKKREYAKTKMIEKTEGDWRNGKYVYAISSAIAFIHDIDSYLNKCDDVLEEIIGQLCSLNNKSFCRSDLYSIIDSSAYLDIDDSKNNERIVNSEDSTRVVKQKSDTWFARREQVHVTGSTIHNAVGLDGVKKQQEHYDKVICKIECQRSDEVRKNMEYGSTNEINANATFVNSVMPVLFPECIFCEEGFVEIEKNNKPFMIVSPDGSVRTDCKMESTIAAVEFKCPVRELHKRVSVRYYLQCQSEMVALNVDSLYYLCWRPDMSSVFKLRRNDEVFGEALEIVNRLYVSDNHKRPTKLLPESNTLKKSIDQRCQHDIEFVGLFPSVKNDPSISNNTKVETYLHFRLGLLLDKILEVYDNHYELQREKATEAVVFICCDLDREWDATSIRCAPVCWFTKGYSLGTDTMSNILQDVLNTCKSADLHVPAISFDGQWHGIAVRNVEGEPLTVLQVQKDVWKRTEKLTKSGIQQSMKNMNKKAAWYSLTTNRDDAFQKRIIVCTNNGQRVPSISSRVKQSRLKSLKIPVRTAKSPCSFEAQCESVVSGIDNENSEAGICLNGERDVHERTAIGDCTEPGSNTNQDVDCTHESYPNYNEEENVRITEVDNTKMCVIDTHVADSILRMIKTDRYANNKGQWNDKAPEVLQERFQSAKSLNVFRDVELKVIVRYFKKMKTVIINESCSKSKKVEKLCSHFNLRNEMNEANGSQKKGANKTRKIDSLSQLAFKVVTKVLKKSDLNIVHSEYVWEIEYEKWRETCPLIKPFPKELSEPSVQTKTGNDEENIENPIGLNNNSRLDTTDSSPSKLSGAKEDVDDRRYNIKSNDRIPLLDNYFYTGYFSKERCQFEVSCVDSSHLLTRTRRKVCKGGIEGMNNNAWKRVAKSNKTNLSIVMIETILEPMSVPVAAAHFSEAVEQEMRANGDVFEAIFCRDVRLWWRAEDDPAIPAKERVIMRMPLRNRLVKSHDHSHFPPPGMHIRGWPAQLWEALIANIDAKILLYGLSQHGTYNVRAFSSMMGETLFSELTLLDRRGQGTVTVAEFGQFIESSIEKVHVRLDPERPFVYKTARRPVYKLLGNQDQLSQQCNQTSNVDKQSESFFDHPFDNPERRRCKPKCKEESVCSDRNAIQRGSLGVRFESARRNEGKMLPTLRMGIDLDEL